MPNFKTHYRYIFLCLTFLPALTTPNVTTKSVEQISYQTTGFTLPIILLLHLKLVMSFGHVSASIGSRGNNN